MANYDIAMESYQAPYLYGVGKIYEVKNGDVTYLVKSNTEFVRDDVIGTAVVSHYREVGNVFVSDFELLKKVKSGKNELDFTWLGKEDYVALRYNMDYEDVTSIKMNIDNLSSSHFPNKKMGEDDITLVLDGSKTKMSSIKQILTLKDFIERSGSAFKDIKLVGFGRFMEGVLSYTSDREIKSVQRNHEKAKGMEL